MGSRSREEENLLERRPSAASGPGEGSVSNTPSVRRPFRDHERHLNMGWVLGGIKELLILLAVVTAVCLCLEQFLSLDAIDMWAG